MIFSILVFILGASGRYDDVKSMTSDSMPYLLGALALYAGGLTIFPASRQSLIGMATLYLVLLAILTVPHSFISLFIDIEEGLFAS